ncbi:MAG: hypothetical protein D6785_04480 [Planctomycetota bacterium]|nr:MAG: hypothetical protein D6785_04480 [Planctomycetota bacterium]
MRKVWILFIYFFFTGTLFALNPLPSETKPFMAEGKDKNLQIWMNPWKKKSLKWTSQQPVIVLESRGKWAKVFFGYPGDFWISQRKVRISKSGKRGVVLSKASVFQEQGKKNLGFLDKGDFVTIQKKDSQWLLCQSKDLFAIGYVLKKDIQKVSLPLPVRSQGLVLIYQKQHSLSPTAKKILELQKRLKAELAKEVDTMNLKPIILECMALEKDTKEVRYLSMIQELKNRAIQTEKIRQEYLRLTAPLREKIDKIR